MLDLYKLEIFLRVAEEGSFTAAAERLLMTQSGVSQHIRDLERGLGTELFARSRRGVELTAAGCKLHGYAERILHLAAEAENAVTDVARLGQGLVRVQATPGVSIYVLSEWMQTFRTHYPNLTATLETKITPTIVHDLLAHAAEVGFIEGELVPTQENKLGVQVLERIVQYVVVGRKHPFWSRTQVGISELDGQTFVMRQPASQTRIWLDDQLQQHGVQPQIAAEFDSIESIKRVVMGTAALTILPEYAVHDEQEYGLLRTVAVSGEPLQRTLKLIWDRRRLFAPVTRALLAHLAGRFPALALLVAPDR